MIKATKIGCIDADDNYYDKDKATKIGCIDTDDNYCDKDKATKIGCIDKTNPCDEIKAIEVKNLSFSYDGYNNQALKSASFELAYGEIALLAGMSGAGKSTLISLITGIIPNIITGKITGEIYVNGVNISGRAIRDVCRTVGIVLQNADAQIIQQLVEDEIAFGCENFAMTVDEIEAKIADSCRMMRLSPMDNTNTLSGGQKQMLITACTLATLQKIIILDEPLANLDVQNTKILMSVLRGLAEKGYAILIVEHRIDIVMPDIDTAWNMSGGVISKAIDKHEVFSTHKVITVDNYGSSQDKRIAMTLDNLSFAVKKKIILESVNLEIVEGDKLLILGENGCGKTTLMRLISRLDKATSGSITQHFNSKLGQSRGNKKWFRQVGVVYQNPNYQLFMPTVRQEILFSAISKEYAYEIMSMFRIEHLADRHPQSLSEGQKRKVSIAAVVATNPKILILDEPTVGQDYEGLKEMVDTLNLIHKKTGNTMITITHDVRCAEALCDYAVILSDHKVVEVGGRELVREYFKTTHKD